MLLKFDPILKDPGSDGDKRHPRCRVGPPLRLPAPLQARVPAAQGGLPRQAQQLTLHEATHGTCQVTSCNTIYGTLHFLLPLKIHNSKALSVFQVVKPIIQLISVLCADKIGKIQFHDEYEDLLKAPNVRGEYQAICKHDHNPLVSSNRPTDGSRIDAERVRRYGLHGGGGAHSVEGAVHALHDQQVQSVRLSSQSMCCCIPCFA